MKQTQATTIILLLLFFTSCRVTLLPPRDSELVSQINLTSKAVDKLYLTLLETKDSTGRSYTNFAEQYINIEVELTSLYNKNKVRPLNKNSTRICEITLQMWQKYKEEHKAKNYLSDAIIQLNRQSFSDLFYAMQVAEEAKQKY